MQLILDLASVETKQQAHELFNLDILSIFLNRAFQAQRLFAKFYELPCNLFNVQVSFRYSLNLEFLQNLWAYTEHMSLISLYIHLDLPYVLQLLILPPFELER